MRQLKSILPALVLTCLLAGAPGAVACDPYAELKALLATIPKCATTVLTNSDGQPWKSGFSSSWNKAVKAARETQLHFHDARGTFATMAFELDVFSVREIAEMLAWSEDRVSRWAAKPIISRSKSASALFSISPRKAIMSSVIFGPWFAVVVCKPDPTEDCG